jgi:hypothetical protein
MDHLPVNRGFDSHVGSVSPASILDVFAGPELALYALHVYALQSTSTCWAHDCLSSVFRYLMGAEE